MADREELQRQIEERARAFAAELATVITRATVQEIAAGWPAVTDGVRAGTRRAADRRNVGACDGEGRGFRDVGASGTDGPESAAVAPVAGGREGDGWPTCVVEGCDRKVYRPSGDTGLCFRHHLERSGRKTPLAKARRAARAAADRRGEPSRLAGGAGAAERTDAGNGGGQVAAGSDAVGDEPAQDAPRPEEPLVELDMTPRPRGPLRRRETMAPSVTVKRRSKTSLL